MFIQDVQVEGNVAVAFGGGVCVSGLSNVEFLNSKVAGNACFGGGAGVIRCDSV
jgi:hypothetical protein